MRFLNQVSRVGTKPAVGDRNGSWDHPSHVGVGGIGEENLPPAIHGCSPGVGDGKPGGAFQVASSWIVAKETSVGTADWSVGRFNVTVQKRALAHVDGPTGVGTKGADDVMGIVIIKTAEKDLSLVDLVIPIGVAQQYEMRALGQVDPFACQFKAGRQV